MPQLDKDQLHITASLIAAGQLAAGNPLNNTLINQSIQASHQIYDALPDGLTAAGGLTEELRAGIDPIPDQS